MTATVHDINQRREPMLPPENYPDPTFIDIVKESWLAIIAAAVIGSGLPISYLVWG